MGGRRPTSDTTEGGDAPHQAASRGEPRPSLQERVEGSRAGRSLLSAVLTLAAVMAWNLPSSALREAALPVVEPYVRVLGLDHTRSPRDTFEVLARIDYADGSSGEWRAPRTDRWRKWLGAVRLDHKVAAGLLLHVSIQTTINGRVVLHDRRRGLSGLHRTGERQPVAAVPA